MFQSLLGEMAIGVALALVALLVLCIMLVVFEVIGIIGFGAQPKSLREINEALQARGIAPLGREPYLGKKRPGMKRRPVRMLEDEL